MTSDTYVVIGYTRILLDQLDLLVPTGSVVVLEEPEIIARRELTGAAAAHPCLREVVPCSYQTESWLGDGPAPRRPEGVTAVLPGSEYAVCAAAELAELWGLPSAGPQAAHRLRNKDELRARVHGYLPQPEWSCPASEQDLLAFAERFSGRVVLKPSNGQASAGVIRCDGMADVAAHRDRFDDFSGDPLRAASIRAPRLMVEQRITGPEYSVESLVADGEVIFQSITAKTVAAGRHPVELGHVVPAPLAAPIQRRVEEQVDRLVRLVGVRTAVLHSEWIIVSGQPHLIECAGRLPGDNITALISEAWGYDFPASWISLMSGRRPQVPAAARRAAAIWFLTADSGTVVSVPGPAEVMGCPGVLEFVLSVEPGSVTSELRNSWDRVGYVMAAGRTPQEAVGNAQRAAGTVKVVVTGQDSDQHRGAHVP